MRASRGRSSAAQPRAGSPEATAPDETTTTSIPRALSPAISCDAFATAATSIAPSASVRLDVPILTTTRTAQSASSKGRTSRRTSDS